jgi:hypothetical protein
VEVNYMPSKAVVAVYVKAILNHRLFDNRFFFKEIYQKCPENVDVVN